MLVYLLRHAIAVERGTAAYPNDDRPLTEQGKEKMSKAAKGMAKLIPSIDLILSSPMIRAHDTAKIAARALRAENKLEMCTELAPGGPLKNLMIHLAKYRSLQSIMLVGHQPDLGYVAGVLLGSEGATVEFKKGSLCCIEIATLSSRSKGKILWHLQPKQLRSIS
jgi:phosphohistidine phosphatase